MNIRILAVIASAIGSAVLMLPDYKTNETPGIQGNVVAVIDGDTLDVMSGSQKMRVRLASIDAPEMAQAYGVTSRNELAKLVQGKPVVVQIQGRDKYGRVIGEVALPRSGCGQSECSPFSVNLGMVERGHAWAYTQYATSREYARAEDRARSHRAGLWIQGNPQAPWEFRRAK